MGIKSGTHHSVLHKEINFATYHSPRPNPNQCWLRPAKLKIVNNDATCTISHQHKTGVISTGVSACIERCKSTLPSLTNVTDNDYLYKTLSLNKLVPRNST